MKFEFHPEAEDEFFQAVRRYEELVPNLGAKFSKAVEMSVEDLLVYPMAWPTVRSTIRRALMKRFPYAILYSVAEDRLRILAVMHLSRRPGYWLWRMS